MLHPSKRFVPGLGASLPNRKLQQKKRRTNKSCLLFLSGRHQEPVQSEGGRGGRHLALGRRHQRRDVQRHEAHREAAVVVRVRAAAALLDALFVRGSMHGSYGASLSKNGRMTGRVIGSRLEKQAHKMPINDVTKKYVLQVELMDTRTFLKASRTSIYEEISSL